MLLEITFNNLHQLLQNLYWDMLPLCGEIANIAKVIAGIGALFYVSYRVWQALARAEAIDVFPLLRPFCISMCILFFPTLVVGSVNGILSPVVKGCRSLVDGQVFSMNKFQRQKDEAEKQVWKQAGLGFICDDEEMDKEIENMNWNPVDMTVTALMFRLHNDWTIMGWITKALRAILEFIFEAASLVIDTIRTFFLIVLTILGPLAFAFSVYDGFTLSIVHWLGRYITVYLWLPISDIFGAILSRIQIITLQYDLENMTTVPFTGSLSGSVYLIFLAIGIMGYFSVPSISNWVIHSCGLGSYMHNVNNIGRSAGNIASAAGGSTVGKVAGALLH